MSTTTKPRVTFPPVVTASKWDTLLSSLRGRARAANGGGDYPRLTNAEAVAMITAWKAAVTPMRFPLWFQFAAIAYGWDPPENDVFDTNRGDKMYPRDFVVQLWLQLARLATDLDKSATPEPRVVFDGARFDDVETVAQVRARLLEDGAKAEFTLPALPAAKLGAVETTKKPANQIKLGTVALILGALWLLGKNKPRRRRRTK